HYLIARALLLSVALAPPFYVLLAQQMSGGAGVLGVVTWMLAALDSSVMAHGLAHALLFLVLTVAHGGVRLGRKVYLVDMAHAGNRAQLVAVSNTLIGVIMLAAGSIGIFAGWLGPAPVVLILGIASLAAAVYCMRLEETAD